MAQVFDFFLQHLAFGHFELHAELFVHFQHSLELFQVFFYGLTEHNDVVQVCQDILGGQVL